MMNLSQSMPDLFTPLPLHHNTNGLNEPELRIVNKKAESSEKRIENLFLKLRIPLAWFEVRDYLHDMNIKSLCRGLTNLTTDIKDKKTGEVKRKAILRKTDVRVTEFKDSAPCHKYELI